MAKAKNKKKTPPKAAPRQPKSAVTGRNWPRKTEERLKGARKIGIREEQIQLDLSPSEVENERGIVCDKLREIDRIKESAKTAAQAAKARITELTEERDIALRNANTKRRDVTIDVEEWLDAGNQVIRIRADSGEIIGGRSARVDELQETLFGDEDGEGDEGEAPAAEGEANTTDTPEVEGDFGETENP